MRRLLAGLFVALLLVGATSIPIFGQGLTTPNPFSLLARDNTWSGTNTFSGTFSLTGTPSVTGVFTESNNAIALTSTDGVLSQNTTPATGGTTVQRSPRIRLCGTAYNSSSTLSEIDCWYMEVLPATVAGTTTSTLIFSRNQNGGTYTQELSVNNSGTGNFTGSLSAGGGMTLGAGNALNWSGRSVLSSTADKLVTLLDSGSATGTEFNNGTPTLGTCTGGTLVSGSHNDAGEVTGNTSGSCVINFGTPNYTNTPFCALNDETTLTAIRISARSNSSITVTGAVSGDAFQWICLGRIGT